MYFVFDGFLARCHQQQTALSLIESSQSFMFSTARKTRSHGVSCRWLLYNSVLFATSISTKCDKAHLKTNKKKTTINICQESSSIRYIDNNESRHSTALV